jgi:YidC/Oxa1 family membrane protein insertase
MNDQKNTLLFIVLSAVILIGWQLLVWDAAAEAGRAPPDPPATSAPGTPLPRRTNHTAEPAAKRLTREEALAQSPRVRSRRRGLSARSRSRAAHRRPVAHAISRDCRPEIAADRAAAPSGSPHPLYAEWAGSRRAARPSSCRTIRRSGPSRAQAARRRSTAGSLYDNGEGLEFRRTITVDDKYMFTVQRRGREQGLRPVVLHPFGLISRHGTPKLEGYLVSTKALSACWPTGCRRKNTPTSKRRSR